MFANDPRNHDSEIGHVTLGSVESVSPQGENRSDKQQAGTCVRKGCRREADDGDYCRQHARAQRAYHAAYMARRRQEWDAAQACTSCGARERKRGSKWCTACVIRDERQQLSSVNPQGENRRERMAKRLIAWTNSPHNEGRLRMRGGKRGAPSAQDRDRRDLADIRRVLDRYALALDEAYGAETQALSRIQRDATVRAAHAGLALAVRLGMEALVTYGYECPVLAEDFDPGGDGIDHDLAVQGREIVKSGR